MFVPAISLCRLLLDPTSLGVGFVVDKVVALVQVFLPVHLFLPVSIIPTKLHNHLHLRAWCCYQKDKRAKPGNNETKQCSFERIRRIDVGCLCIEGNSCVDQKSCRALNTAQRYFDSVQPTIRKLQRSTWSSTYKHGNISNLPGCFWKYSVYEDRAPAMFWTERTK